MPFVVSGTCCRRFYPIRTYSSLPTRKPAICVVSPDKEPSANCSKAGSGQKLKCLAINALRSQIYALGDGIVNVLNPTLRTVKQYLKADSTAHMDSTSKCYFCVEKSMVLFNNNTGTGVRSNLGKIPPPPLLPITAFFLRHQAPSQTTR